MQFYILYWVCVEEHECEMDQKSIDHIEGIFATRRSVDDYLNSEWGSRKVPLYENAECKGAKEYPCYFLHKYDTILSDGEITTNWV